MPRITPAFSSQTDPSSQARWLLLLLFFFILCIALGLPGLSSVPLESHEIFVAQSTQEMALRGDWMVPYFNETPRLNKPPLSYWLTGLVAFVSGSLPVVEAWHARLVSTLAGAGMVVLTLISGAWLYGRLTAVVAAVVLVTSAGLVSYLHDARPDTLYAFWCMAGLTAFIRTQCSEEARSQGGFGRISPMWICYGLAVLSKGPHIPALMLVGTVVWLARERRSAAAVMRVLCPVRGLASIALMCGPWWWVMSHRVGAEVMHRSQLGGSLLTPELSHLLNLYYFYRPLQLTLPWLPLVFVALVSWWSLKPRPRVGLLGFPIIITAIGLTLGHQYRYFYLLPLLPAFCLLCAAGIVPRLLTPQTRGWRIALWITLAVQGLTIFVAVAWVVQRGALPLSLLLVVAGLCGAGMVLCLQRIPRHANSMIALLCAGGVLLAGAWPLAAGSGILWNQERYNDFRMATLARETLSPQTPMAAYGISPTVYVYYGRRHVPSVRSVEEIRQLLAAAPRAELGLVVRENLIAALGSEFVVTELDRIKRGSSFDVLLRLQPAPSANEPVLEP